MGEQGADLTKRFIEISGNRTYAKDRHHQDGRFNTSRTP
jgi:hypothetical protein